MVKTYKTSSVLPYSWKDVALVFFQRYPNPFSLHVLTIDTVQRSITSDGCLFTKRLITKTNKIPKWGKFIMQGYYGKKTPSATIIEESLIDLKNRTIYTLTRNFGLSTNLLSVTEVNIYERNLPDTVKSIPLDAEDTLLRKEAKIQSRLYGLRHALESFGLKRFKKNSTKATAGFLWALERTFGKKEVITGKSTDENEKNDKGGLRRYFSSFRSSTLFAKVK